MRKTFYFWPAGALVMAKSRSDKTHQVRSNHNSLCNAFDGSEPAMSPKVSPSKEGISMQATRHIFCVPQYPSSERRDTCEFYSRRGEGVPFIKYAVKYILSSRRVFY